MTYLGWYHEKGHVQRIPKMHLARVKACVLEGLLFFSDERTDINFIERTGNTQGITFKIKPAINDINI